MRVLVDGVGPSATDLLQVITAHWDLLDAETVHAHVRDVRGAEHPHLERLKNLGVVLVGDEYPAQARVREVAHLVDYVFHTGEVGSPGGAASRAWHGSPCAGFASLRGTSHLVEARSDGGCTTVGPSSAPRHVLGVEGDPGVTRCVRIPDRGTHAAAAVLRALTDGRPEDVLDAELTTCGTVPEPQVLSRLFACDLPVRCRKSHEQPECVLDFRIRLSSTPDESAARDRIDRAPYVTSTGLGDPREIAEVGRRFGLAGRLYHQAVFVEPGLTVRDGEVTGRVYVPDGGPLLSTMSAFLRRTRDSLGATRRLDQLAESLLLERL